MMLDNAQGIQTASIDSIDELATQLDSHLQQRRAPSSSRELVKAQIRYLHEQTIQNEVDSPHFMRQATGDLLSNQGGTFTFRASKGTLKKHS